MSSDREQSDARADRRDAKRAAKKAHQPRHGQGIRHILNAMAARISERRAR